MKLHCSPDHPSFHPVSAVCTIFVNGAPQDMVIYADEEAGYICQVQTDVMGRIEYDPLTETVVVKRVYGHVEISIPDNAKHLVSGVN